MAKNNYKKILENKSFILVNFLNPLDEKSLKEFDKLRNDKYLNNSKWVYRKRSFAQGILSKKKVIWSKNYNFFQSKKINKFAGGIKRKFPKMSSLLKNSVDKILKDFFSNQNLLKRKFYFGAHAIRILCNKKNKGYPVPEGFHTDGVDFVAIVPINFMKSKGGVSYLKDSKKNKIVFKKKLHNKILIFNDRKLLHYATPISITQGNLGFRDIFVFTFLKK